MIQLDISIHTGFVNHCCFYNSTIVKVSHDKTLTIV